VSAWVDGALSDVVGGIHTRHEDEGDDLAPKGNLRGHHSFYVVFQRQAAGVVVKPDPGEEPVATVDLSGMISAAESIVEDVDALKARVQAEILDKLAALSGS
jgi:hypothetical protein